MSVAQTLDDPRAAIRARVAAAGTSFYWAMRLLPEERRDGMFAIYAFCREVDDIADDDNPPPVKRAQLAEWRGRIDAIYEGHPDTDLARVLQEVADAYKLRREDFLAVVDGMEMDAVADIRAPSLAELDLYCDRVASAVGRLSVRIFGTDVPAADRVAAALGRALQLTNILRDLQEDAERGRLYLAREWLDEAAVPHDPALALASPGLPQACKLAAASAHACFRQARDAMPACNRRAMKPARLMGATYAALLARLERSGWREPGRRVSLPAWQKLWLAVRYGIG
jgi:presqualene diphosphate synthase